MHNRYLFSIPGLNLGVHPRSPDHSKQKLVTLGHESGVTASLSASLLSPSAVLPNPQDENASPSRRLQFPLQTSPPAGPHTQAAKT